MATERATTRAFTFRVLAIICASWFLLTGWVWFYGICLLIAYPVGITGFILWWKTRKLAPDNKWNELPFIMLMLGLTISVIVLLLLK